MTIGDDLDAGGKVARFIASGGLEQALTRGQTTLADAIQAMDELKLVLVRAQQTVKIIQDGLK
jgi:hypothetical protein